MSRISSLNGNNTSTPALVTDSITLNGTTVNSIESVNPTKADALISRSALDKELYNINRALKAVDPEGDLFQDLSVISMSLVDNYFSDESDWVIKDWILQDNYAYCKGPTSSDNSLGIANSVFSDNGYYYCFIDVGAIQSGYLELRLNGEFVNKLDKAKQYICELKINDVATDKVELVGCNISSNEAIRINSFGFYYLTDRFYYYLVDKIKKLATITSDNFITREEYSHAQDQFLAQFSALTTRYLAELRAHEEAINPHHISWDNIGAAAAQHTHPDYITHTDFQLEVDNRMSNYAKVNHTHSEYLSKDDASTLVKASIESRLKLLKIIPPNVISNGPTGLVPPRCSEVNISAPGTLLLPSTVQHNSKHTYDVDNGIVTTNRKELLPEIPKVFAKDEYCIIPWGTTGSGTTVRIQFHTERVISGYKLICKGTAKVTDWRVISGNTTFVHRVTNPTNYVASGLLNTCELYFDDPVTTDSLSFILLAKDGSDDNVAISIEFIYSDLDLTDIGLTSKEFSLCMPEDGSNRTLTRESVKNTVRITPPVQVNNIPLYLFAQASPDANGDYDLSITSSYIPVEIANTRKGVTALQDNYIDVAKTIVNGHESYNNPAFGVLSIESGTSATDSALKVIYDTTETSWKSEQSESGQVIITQSFASDNVLLMGYTLTWKKEDLGNIPSTWILTIEGTDKSNKAITMVYDSVDSYYPFCSAEANDIVYTAKFDTGVRVKKIYLTLTSNDTKVISLNRVDWFVSEHFYSIAQNTMYRGNDKVTRMCIGTAVKDKDTGWNVHNLYLGKSCVIPINDLELADTGEEYTIPNPFFTTDVIVTVYNYQPSGVEEDIDNAPSAYVSSITCDKIKIITQTPFRYAASVCRTW